MSEGFVYCFSNSSMPGILKIGMTIRTPEARLLDANSSDTWRPPTPYIIEFAKKVSNPKQIEFTTHIFLTENFERINPKREFFRISIDDAKNIFDLIDGDYWIKPKMEITNSDIITKKKDYTYKIINDNDNDISNSSKDMTKYFTNGQYIRHIIGINKSWVGIYNSEANCIIYDNTFYNSLSDFANMHYKCDNPKSLKRVNGWKECQYEINGEWVSTYNMNSII